MSGANDAAIAAAESARRAHARIDAILELLPDVKHQLEQAEYAKTVLKAPKEAEEAGLSLGSR